MQPPTRPPYILGLLSLLLGAGLAAVSVPGSLAGEAGSWIVVGLGAALGVSGLCMFIRSGVTWFIALVTQVAAGAAIAFTAALLGSIVLGFGEWKAGEASDAVLGMFADIAGGRARDVLWPFFAGSVLMLLIALVTVVQLLRPAVRKAYSEG